VKTGMKYVGFWEFCPEDIDKIAAKTLKFKEEREKNPERFTKVLFPAHSMGQCNGLTIVEASDQMQLMNTTMFWFPEMKLKYIPIYDTSQMTELYQKM